MVLVGAAGNARLPRVRLYRRRAQEGRRGRQAQCVRQAPARPLSCPLLDGGFCALFGLVAIADTMTDKHLALPRHEAGRELRYFLRNSALCHVPRRLRALHVVCNARQGRRRIWWRNTLTCWLVRLCWRFVKWCWSLVKRFFGWILYMTRKIPIVPRTAIIAAAAIAIEAFLTAQALDITI